MGFPALPRQEPRVSRGQEEGGALLGLYFPALLPRCDCSWRSGGGAVLSLCALAPSRQHRASVPQVQLTNTALSPEALMAELQLEKSLAHTPCLY